MSYLSDELARVIDVDRRTEVALDLDQERADQRAEKAPRGAAYGEPDDCPRCHGSGEVTERGMSVNPMTGMRSPDPQCDVPHTCPGCDGDGAAR